MGHVKVLMVKHDKRESEQLKNIISNLKDYEYAGCCEKGENVIKQIMENKPDIVIVDEVVAGTDIPEMVDSVHRENTGIILNFCFPWSERKLYSGSSNSHMMSRK